jgi:Protein of unknown function (DUF1573)
MDKNKICFMKKIMVISLMLVAIIASNCGSRTGKNSSDSASDKNSTGTSEIVFREYQHDFGKVAEGEKISYTFTFENKGTGDLVISSATTTCGCTVPKYDTKPIPPEANGNLEVVFDTSGRSGMQTKTITVKSNASKPVVLLKITAEVVTNNK